MKEYSDFGGATVWKLSSRYKFADDKITLRGSCLDSEHLHYTKFIHKKAQYSFVAGQGIISGIIQYNVSPQARIFGVPQLDAENQLT
jgi:iron complex outermembrane receptor protein